MAKKPAVKTLMLHSGYVETESLAGVILTHREGFKNVNDALASLAEIFRLPELSKATCCTETKAANKSAVFCMLCGTNLKDDSSLYNDIESDIRDFLVSDLDGLGASYDELEDAGWQLGYDVMDLTRAYVVFETPYILTEILDGRKIEDYYIVKVGG